MCKLKTILLYAAIIATIIWILATPLVYIYAAKNRLFPGIGGEFFWPFIPLPFWQIGITVRDLIRESEEVNEDEN